MFIAAEPSAYNSRGSALSPFVCAGIVTIVKPKNKTIKATMICQAGVVAEMEVRKMRFPIKTMIDPVIANFFGPILSNSVPTIGDIITFTALPGSDNKLATAALNNNDPFKYNGKRIPVDKMTKILKKHHRCS